MSRILLVGASGTVGSELARLLAAQGERVVRGTSQQPTAPDQVRIDLVSGVGLSAAFEGVDRAFLLCPPGHANQDELLAPLIDEARSRSLNKVVLMTAMGVDADDAIPFRRSELRLKGSGLPYNIIRPNWFMQNFNTIWMPALLQQGKIRLPVGNAKGSFIDARDIAAVAAKLLTSDDFANRDFDLTGPTALDHDTVSAILSQETGRRVTFEDISQTEMLKVLLADGVRQPYAGLLIQLLELFKAGYSERMTDAVTQILPRAPATFEQYARDYRTVFTSQKPG